MAYGVISGLYLSSLPDFDAGVADAFGRPAASSGLTYDSLFNKYYTDEALADAVTLRAVVAAVGLAGVFGGMALLPRKGRNKAALSVA